MKKSLFILCSLILLTFYSCENDEPPKTQYLDNKLIEGRWYGIHGKDSTLYTFKDNKASHELYAFVLGMEALKYEGKIDHGSYLLTDSHIIVSNPVDLKYMYRLNNNNDSLYICNPVDKPILWIGLKKHKK